MSNEHQPTTLYERLPNGKYKPVSEYMQLDYWERGSYIVDIKPGCTSIIRRQDVTRAVEDVQIVLNRLQDKICTSIVRERHEPKKPQKLTKKQIEAYNAWCEAFKTDKIMLCSIHNAVEKALEEVVNEVIKLRGK